jgi:hypothetical protein
VTGEPTVTPTVTPAREGIKSGQRKPVEHRISYEEAEGETFTAGRTSTPEISAWVDEKTGKEYVELWHKSSAFGVPLPPEINKEVALEHWWIETPTNSFGMGPLGGRGTDPPPGVIASLQVGINPHDEMGKAAGGGPASGYYVTRIYGPPGFTAKVNEFARSQALGTIFIDGTCQTFCSEVLIHAGAEQIPERFGSSIYLDALFGGPFQVYGP